MQRTQHGEDSAEESGPSNPTEAAIPTTIP